MEVCFLCFSSCENGCVSFKTKANGRSLGDALRDHFPFVSISCESVLVACTECFDTVTIFDGLFIKVKKNHCQSLLKAEPALEIKSEPTTEDFTECVFVNDLPQIEQPETSHEAQFKEELKGVKEESLVQECSSNEGESDDGVPSFASDSDESYKEEPPKKRARVIKLAIKPAAKPKTSRQTLQKPKEKVKPTPKSAKLEEKPAPDRKKFKIRKYFASERTAEYLEQDKIVKEFLELKCEVCSSTFENFLTMQRHYRQMHPDAPSGIFCCGRRLTSRHYAVEHITSLHLIKFQKCPHCEQLFKTMKKLYDHMCSEHSKFKCWVCQRGFLQQKPMNNHVKYCELTGRKFECIICKKDTFQNFFKLKAHQLFHKIVEAEKMAGAAYVCETCPWSSSSRSKLQQHRKTHAIAKYFNEKGGYKCQECGKFLRSQRTLEVHMKIMHLETEEERLEECKICGKKVKWMTTHLTVHKDDPKVCKQCGVTCKNRVLLNSHTRIAHVLKADKECQYCEKKFKRKNQLQEHEATHTKTPLYFCEFCAKPFYQLGNYSSHRKKVHGVNAAGQKIATATS